MIGLAVGAVLVTTAFQFREEFLNAPRVRVGPLVQSVIPASPQIVRFFVLGDTGTGGEAQYKVAAAMEARCREVENLEGILLLGDNAYQAGFQGVDDPEWQSKVEIPYGSPCLSKIKIYPILGNHDYKGNPTAQIEYSLINRRWHMPNRFYAVQFGDLVKLVGFDSQTNDFCGIPAFCSNDFLWEQTKPTPVSEMPGSKAPWIFVMGHHPLASASDRGFNHTGGIKGKIFKALFCQKVDVWLAGHAHHMEHRIPEGCRLEHYVLGGGGANLYGVIAGDPDVKFAKSTYGFAEFVVEPQAVTTKFFNQDGELLYETRKTRPGL